MKPIEIVAQALGIVAMALNIYSYQGKKKSTVIGFQLFGGALFAANFLLLGAVVGGVMNMIAVVRAVVFLLKDKFKADKPLCFILFFIAYVTVYVLSFTLWGKEPTFWNFVIELLPVIGMTSLHIGFMLKKAADVRKCALVASPAWLIYNAVAGSWGGILCEVFSLCSVFVGMLRHDHKKA